MGKVKDLKGQKFGKLLVIEQQGINEKRGAIWLCKCECGNEKLIVAHDLKHGTTSCGCVLKDSRMKNLKLGWGNRDNFPKIKRIYSIWRAMKARCYAENNKNYENYGGRGITICEEWLNDYRCFETWALNNGYEDKLTIDRKENNLGYSPSNCKWITIKEQQVNKRTNVLVTIEGTTQTISQWCSLYNIKHNTFRARIMNGKTGLELIAKVGGN